VTIRLFTTWYEDPRPDRQKEYALCLAKNLECDAIDEVYLLVERMAVALPSSPKLNARHLDRRPTYDDFVGWINEISAANDVSIIANTDIYFDDSVAITSSVMPRDQVYALARWDGDRLFYRNDSQDAWIFHGPIRSLRGDFHVGVPRCDNRFIHELRTAGYHVRNPSFAIKAYHVHLGEPRHYTLENEASWVAPPYGYIWPHNLLSFRRTLLHNALHSSQRIAWRIDRRTLFFTLPGRIVRRLRRAVTSKRSAS
jgi:hypothetical protein